ncbi:hypothetical protein OsccyDRAFT_2064 [Leptolyngbyaceae cyanobacterium JSC-12]|nr:hypothetical protein OsccyDRAFT_2064 [Leptolyngbyaceae cyanobacterium JSC-12]
MMQLSRRQTIILAIALVSLILLILFLAPSSGNVQQYGSTYSRIPQGYGAWYAFMEKRGTSLQRWRRPLSDLYNAPPAQPNNQKSSASIPKPPITLIRISGSSDVLKPDDEWVKQGNVLVLLGMKPRVTDTPFTSDLDSPNGKIRIETRRRQVITGGKTKAGGKETALLSDRAGAVVWQETLDKGKIIYSSTPYLAANAYQDHPANYEFLATLVTEPGYPIWVDEFMHGHEDKVAKVGDTKTEDDLITYLFRTPLSLLALQSVIILAVLIWGQNRRFGTAEPLVSPVIDNSEAYIQAMAGVLHKANCSEFVLETIGKAEQLEIQKALGLGTVPLSLEVLAEAWEQQTGRSPETLQSMLRTTSRHRRLTHAELQQWIVNIQVVRQTLPYPPYRPSPNSFPDSHSFCLY